jgi:hypothetical protein
MNQSSQTNTRRQQEKPVRHQKALIKRRDILILIGVWSAGCVIVTALLSFFYANVVVEASDRPKPVATFVIPFEEGNLAQTVYPPALEEAQNWQSDAEMVAVSTRWSKTTVEDLGQAGLWDFRFFSAEHQRVFFAVVTPDRQVMGRAHIHKLRYTPNVINQANWLLDSDEAISIWVNQGGGNFLNAFPDNNVEVLLRQTPDREGPVWDIIGTNADQSQMFYLSIDAANGQILNNQSVPTQ